MSRNILLTNKQLFHMISFQETSTEQYKKAVSRKFKSVVGDPAWASLDKGADSYKL